MPESLHALMSATRDDIAAMRREMSASRQETARLATEVARLAAEAMATRRELEHHRDDDRRQMADLAAEDQQLEQTDRMQQAQIDALRTWRAWMAGALAVVMMLVTGLALPVLSSVLTGG